MKEFNISVGNIPVGSSDSDEDLRRKAHAHLPNALQKIGEELGEKTWGEMQRALKGGPLKLSPSSGERSKFIRDQAAQFVRKASSADKKKIEDQIFEQLKQQRGEKRD